MNLNPEQQRKMTRENSDAGLGDRAIDQLLQKQQSQRLSMHALKVVRAEETDNRAVLPLSIKRMPDNGSFC